MATFLENAKPKDVLQITAAYTAVLVVFARSTTATHSDGIDIWVTVMIGCVMIGWLIGDVAFMLHNTLVVAKAPSLRINRRGFAIDRPYCKNQEGAENMKFLEDAYSLAQMRAIIRWIEQTNHIGKVSIWTLHYLGGEIAALEQDDKKKNLTWPFHSGFYVNFLSVQSQRAPVYLYPNPSTQIGGPSHI